MRRRDLITTAACLAAAAVLIAGCDDPAGLGELLPEHGLGWGRELADSVRDEEFPEGSLCMASCVDVDDEGRAETGLPWMFVYRAQADTTDLFVVLVQYVGTTDHYWDDSLTVPPGQLPAYDDAGPWVTAAKDSLGAAYADWEEYALLVQSNDYPQFPQAVNVAVLQFMEPDSTGQISVVLNPDQGSVLGFLQY